MEILFHHIMLMNFLTILPTVLYSRQAIKSLGSSQLLAATFRSASNFWTITFSNASPISSVNGSRKLITKISYIRYCATSGRLLSNDTHCDSHFKCQTPTINTPKQLIPAFFHVVSTTPLQQWSSLLLEKHDQSRSSNCMNFCSTS